MTEKVILWEKKKFWFSIGITSYRYAIEYARVKHVFNKKSNLFFKGK